MPRVLLIDDDERLAELLSLYFERSNIELESATIPSDGLARLRNREIKLDLVVLDIMLPEMDGFEVCKAIRKTSEIPIIMLTARGDVMDRVVGLELGADDYLPKPFEPRELVARINSILKRIKNGNQNDSQLVYGALKIDMDLRQASLDNTVLELSALEYQFLELLVQNPGKTFTRDELLNKLKGIDADIYTRSVDILVSRLRHKLKPTNFIKTIRGSGYCFVGKKA